MVQWRHEPKENGVTTYTFRIVVEPDEDRWRAYARRITLRHQRP